MSKHTPGPWSWIAYNPQSNQMELLEAATGDVCNFGRDTQYYPSCGEPPSPADMRLITAAPDLLAALQGVVRVADRATVEFDAARSAIKKATGN